MSALFWFGRGSNPSSGRRLYRHRHRRPAISRDQTYATLPAGTALMMIVIAGVATTACGPESPAPEFHPRWMDATLPEERDSSGVTIVTNTLDCLADLPLIQLDTVPALSIGEADGPPGATLHQVRAAVTRSDGSIVIADDAGTVLRAYAPDGRLLGSYGRRGRGPGEYSGILALGTMQADSLVVYDWGSNSRIGVLDTQFRFARSIPLVPSRGLIGRAFGPYILGTPNAVLLERERQMRQPGDRYERDPYIRQDTLSLVLLRADGDASVTDTLMQPPGITSQVQETERGSSGRSIVFSSSPLLAGNATGFVFAHGSRFEILRFDTTGKLRQVIRLAVRPRPVTAEDRQPREEAFRRRPASEQQAGTLQGLPPAFADHHPLLNGLLLDAAGNIWVRLDPELAGADREWLVLGPDGKPRAWYSGLPGSFSILHAGKDHLLILSRTANIEMVQMFRVTLP